MSSKESPNIIVLLREKQWSKVRPWIANSPSEAKRIFLLETRNGSTSYCSPLHVACIRQPPVEILMALLAANIHAVSLKDTLHGRLPIHFACYYNASMKVIGILMGMKTESLHVKAKDGSLPIHLACRHSKSDQNSFEVIEVLARNSPSSLRAIDNHGKTPMDYLVTQNEAQRSSSTRIIWTLKEFMGKDQQEEDEGSTVCSPKKRLGPNERTEVEEKMVRSPTKLCVVCMVEGVTHVLVPCGHPSLCSECAGRKSLASLN